METKPALPESLSLPARDERRSTLRLGLVVVGVLLLALLVWLVFASLSGNKLVWLTPAELARSTQPGPFADLKQRVRNLAGPVWRRLRRAQPLISLDCKVLTLSSAALEKAGLGAAATTNADGMRAWIFTPTETSGLRQQFKTNSAASSLGSPSIATFGGGQARVVVGNAGAAVGVPRTDVTIDLIPKLVSSSIKLTIGATAIESPGALRNSQPGKTNFVLACQAMIPSGGSLVVDGGSPIDGGENKYLLIVSPRIWNPADKPAK